MRLRTSFAALAAGLVAASAAANGRVRDRQKRSRKYGHIQHFGTFAEPFRQRLEQAPMTHGAGAAQLHRSLERPARLEPSVPIEQGHALVEIGLGLC